jgi:hypothetical protein
MRFKIEANFLSLSSNIFKTIVWHKTFVLGANKKFLNILYQHLPITLPEPSKYDFHDCDSGYDNTAVQLQVRY